MELKKRGFYFSMDALIALFILVMGLTLLPSLYLSKQPTSEMNFLNKDIVQTFSSIQVSDYNNTVLAEMISNGSITLLNNSILEQIGILWATNETGLAQKLVESVFADLIPSGYGFSIYAGNDSIFTRGNESAAKELITYRTMVTGIEYSRPILGTAARIYMTDVNKQYHTRYIYFGGFVGQGNISVYMDKIPDDANISEVYLELATPSNLSLYINNQLCNLLNITGDYMNATAWDVTYCEPQIVPGKKNNISINFTSILDNAYIGGGYMKVKYTTQELYNISYDKQTYRFPGINGIINLYDAFHVPGRLTKITAYIHYLANHSNATNSTVYLTVGNSTIFRDNTSNTTQFLTIDNASFESNFSEVGLNYSFLSNKTVPIRLGFENISTKGQNLTIDDDGDAVLVTDRSGSMEWHLYDTNPGNELWGSNCSVALADPDIARKRIANCTNSVFIRNITEHTTGNRVGLVTYNNNFQYSDGNHSLSTNTTTLLEANERVMSASGGTCLGCGIDGSIGTLIDDWSIMIEADSWWSFNSSPQLDGWQNMSFDASSWDNITAGYPILKDIMDLWDLSADSGSERVDFSSGINSTANTFGIFNRSVYQDWTSNQDILKQVSFYDNFNRANSDSLGPDWVENEIGGSRMRIVSNDYWYEGDNGYTGSRNGGVGPHSVISGSNTWSDYIINTTLYPNDNDGFGLLFRYQDDQNHYRLRFDNEDVFSRLERIQGGARTVLWSDESSSSGFDRWDWSELVLNVSGNEFTFFEDGVQIAQVTDPINLYPSGGVALYSWAMSYLIYDWVNVSSEESIFPGDWWTVDTDIGRFGYLNHSFSLESLDFFRSTLVFNTTSDDAVLDGTLRVFCNITHPGGEDIVLDFNWSQATNTEGSMEHQIDLSSYLTAVGFDYRAECGAYVEASGGRTAVGLRGLYVDIYYNTSSDDGYDWQNGTYVQTSDDDITHGYDSTGQKIFMQVGPASTGGPESVASGIQFYLNQTVAQSLSRGNTLMLYMDFTWDDLDDQLEETSCIFATLWNMTEKFSLGDVSQTTFPDMGNAVYCHTGYPQETRQRFEYNLSSFISGPGIYYLDFGLAVDDTSVATEGARAEFDNILIAVINATMYPERKDYYLKKEFTITNINQMNNPMVHLMARDAEIYVNDRIVFDNMNLNDGEIWDRSFSLYDPSVFRDDFKRADNLTVGGGWTETSGTAWRTWKEKLVAQNCGGSSVVQQTFDLSDFSSGYLKFDWMMNSDDDEGLWVKISCPGCPDYDAYWINHTLNLSTEKIDLRDYVGESNVVVEFNCSAVDGGSITGWNSGSPPEYVFLDNIEIIRPVNNPLRMGKNTIAVKLRDICPNDFAFDLEMGSTQRMKALLAMTDGEPNYCSFMDYSGRSQGYSGSSTCQCWNDPDSATVDCPDIISVENDLGGGYDASSEQAIGIACFMHEYYGVDVYSVLIGNSVGIPTMQEIACCGGNCSHYFQSDDAEEIQDIYLGIAQSMIDGFNVERESQAFVEIDEYIYSYLYEDSYIEIEYEPNINPIQPGEVPVFFESDDFVNGEFDLFVPSLIRILEGRVTSYSGPYWTDVIWLNNSEGDNQIFNLSWYSEFYDTLGDPFPLPITGNYFNQGDTNSISVRSSDAPDGSGYRSANNTLMYTGLFNIVNFSHPYSAVKAMAVGCNWTIEVEGGFNISVLVPYNYTGSNICNYTTGQFDKTGHNTDDSYDVAMYELLKSLDLDDDGAIVVNLDNSDIAIHLTTVRDIPYLWGPTLVELRLWR